MSNPALEGIDLEVWKGEFIMDVLNKIHRKDSKTIIIVTHDFYLVKRAERVVYLKDGQVERIEHNHKEQKSNRLMDITTTILNENRKAFI
jgi:putative ABC transport system ATP-binding protein